MKPADFARELVYPLSDMAIVMSMLFFGVIFAIARMAMIMMGILGIGLAIFLIATVVPPYFRYLLFLLEARANGKEAPALDAELFGLADKLWSLTPLVLIALLIWGGISISPYGWVWQILYGFSILALLPASLAILAVTHAPLQSLNPLAIIRMIRACGPQYFFVPVIYLLMLFLFGWLDSLDVWPIITGLGSLYQTVLLFTLTGALLQAKGVAFDLEIEAPLEASEEEVAGDLEKERQKIASHAYGIISRGNREGGFAHIQQWVQSEPDVDAACEWFFRQLMTWEIKDAALFYAQIYFAHLLHHDNDIKALKLISICLQEQPNWKPLPQDRQHAVDLAEKYQRDDLLKSLRN